MAKQHAFQLPTTTHSSGAIQQQLYAVLCLVSSILAALCWRQPSRNSHKRRHLPRDDTILPGPRLRRFLSLLLLISGIHHTLMIIYSPNGLPTICPTIPLVVPTLFLPSLSSLLLLCLHLTSGAMRQLAYTGLGPDFTFRLTYPSGLITTGLYGYVQHPSYTALFVNVFSSSLLLLSPWGSLACFVPVQYCTELVAVWLAFNAVVLWWIWIGLRGRVQDEEDMLERTFGDEWREWNRRTARFVPGLW